MLDAPFDWAAFGALDLAAPFTAAPPLEAVLAPLFARLGAWAFAAPLFAAPLPELLAFAAGAAAPRELAGSFTDFVLLGMSQLVGR